MSSAVLPSNTPARPQPGIVSPWWDMAYVVVTPVLIVLVVLILVRQLLTPDQVSLAVISFASLGQHLPGFMRAYGDRELIRRYPWRFLLVPPLVVALALLFTPPTWLAEELHIPWKHSHGLELVLFVWGTWHGLIRTCGLLQTCDIERGVHDRWSALLDRWLCLVVFIVGVIFSNARVFGIAAAMLESGLPIFGPESLYRVRAVVGVAGLLLLATYLVNFARQYRAGQRVGWIKLLLIGTTGWFYWYTGRLSVNLLIGIVVFEVFHSLQYQAIVWAYNRRLFEQAGNWYGFIGFLFRDRWTMLGLCLAGMGAYGSIRFFAIDPSTYIDDGTSKDAHQWLITLFVTSTFLHFYFDSFIWNMKQRSEQENLRDLPEATARPLRSVPGFADAGKWAIVLASVASLMLAERQWRMNDSESDDFQRLAALAALTPNLPECNALLCRDALSRGDATSAIVFGEKALASQQSSHVAQSDLGLAYLLAGRLDDARKHFVRAVEIAPDQWSHHCDLGAVIARLGQNDHAEAEFMTAVRLAPQQPESYEQLAEFYLQQNRTADAAKLYEQIAKRFPKTLTGELGKIVLLNREGEHHEAVELASFLAAGNVQNWQVLLALGSSLNAAGDPERALVPLEQVARMRPNLAEAQYQLGLARFQLGQYPRTLVLLSRALKLDPRHFAAQLQLGNTYYVLGEADAALEAFQKAHDLRTGDATASANYGGLLAQLGMAEEAEKVYRAALAEHGGSQQLNYNLGILLWQKGERAEAKKLIVRSEELGLQLPPEVKAALEK